QGDDVRGEVDGAGVRGLERPTAERVEHVRADARGVQGETGCLRELDRVRVLDDDPVGRPVREPADGAGRRRVVDDDLPVFQPVVRQGDRVELVIDTGQVQVPNRAGAGGGDVPIDPGQDGGPVAACRDADAAVAVAEDGGAGTRLVADLPLRIDRDVPP